MGEGGQGGDKVSIVIICPFALGTCHITNCLSSQRLYRPLPVSLGAVCPLYAESALMPADIWLRQQIGGDGCDGQYVNAAHHVKRASGMSAHCHTVSD